MRLHLANSQSSPFGRGGESAVGTAADALIERQERENAQKTIRYGIAFYASLPYTLIDKIDPD
jgi:hypothetical protein